MNVSIQVKQTPFPAHGNALIFSVFEDSIEKNSLLDMLNRDTKGSLFELMHRRDFKGKKSELLHIESTGMYKTVVVVGMGKASEVSAATIQNRLADAVRILSEEKISETQILFSTEWGSNYLRIGECIALGVTLGNYHFTKYKTHKKSEEPTYVTKVELCIDRSKATKEIISTLEKGISIGQLTGQGIYLTRDLVNEPASHLYPLTLTAQAKTIVKKSNGAVTVKVLSAKDCAKLGMGAYLGVAQGSDNEPQFIVLHYEGSGSTKTLKGKKRLCLIGKSVTFDTGGYQVKPAEYMTDMKIDMAGGATMLGVFDILSQWDEKKYGEILYDVYGILPACENMISGKAFRPGDVLTALNGKTIEVRHTDAEGRLTLADALSYADRELHADIAIDFATLTGAIMVALGMEIAGVFGNDQKLVDTFLESSRDGGEEAWQMPLPESFKEQVKGTVADLSNLGSKDRWGGAISAAVFLQEFVGKMKWIHVDIAGTSYSDDAPKGVTPKGATGWGVRTLLQILTN